MHNTSTPNTLVSFTKAQGLILAILSLILIGCENKSPSDIVKTEWAEEMAQTEVIIEDITPSGVVTANVIGQYAKVNPYEKVSNREIADFEWHNYRKLEVVYGKYFWATYGRSVRFMASGGPLIVGGKADMVYIKARRTLRNGEQYTQIESIQVRPTGKPADTTWKEGEIAEQGAKMKDVTVTRP